VVPDVPGAGVQARRRGARQRRRQDHHTLQAPPRRSRQRRAHHQRGRLQEHAVRGESGAPTAWIRRATLYYMNEMDVQVLGGRDVVRAALYFGDGNNLYGFALDQYTTIQATQTAL
jgi:hypothetical protein